MALNILRAEVFDPALSGDYDSPARLELLMEDVPEEPTAIELNLGVFSVSHRHWLQSIFCDEPYWDRENTTECAVTFNSSRFTEGREPVFPVFVASRGPSGEIYNDFYVRITRVRRILRKLQELNPNGSGYELLPDPTWAAEKKIGWTLAHPLRTCVRCAEELANLEENQTARDLPMLPGDLQHGSQLVQVRLHRQVPMCPSHKDEWNRLARIRREQEAG